MLKLLQHVTYNCYIKESCIKMHSVLVHKLPFLATYNSADTVFKTRNWSHSDYVLCFVKLHLQLDFFYNLLTWIGFVCPHVLHSLSAILPERINSWGTVMTEIARANKKRKPQNTGLYNASSLLCAVKLAELRMNLRCSAVHKCCCGLIELMSLLGKSWKYVLIGSHQLNIMFLYFVALFF